MTTLFYPGVRSARQHRFILIRHRDECAPANEAERCARKQSKRKTEEALISVLTEAFVKHSADQHGCLN